MDSPILIVVRTKTQAMSSCLVSVSSHCFLLCVSLLITLYMYSRCCFTLLIYFHVFVTINPSLVSWSSFTSCWPICLIILTCLCLQLPWPHVFYPPLWTQIKNQVLPLKNKHWVYALGSCLMLLIDSSELLHIYCENMCSLNH